jgi:prepilin-type N-terminal cleavage/methylation domain-containing protein
MNKRAPGFSLIELMMVVVITAVIMTAVVQSLMSQQRGYRQQTAVVNARQSSRVVLDVLALELRELSTSMGGTIGGDLLMASPDSIRFRAFRKVGLVCEVDHSGTLKVEELGDLAFANGDGILVFEEEAGAWALGEVHGADSEACGTLEARKLTVGSLAGPGVLTGAPVRAFEELGYGIFEIDGQWMLGRRGTNGVIVPLVGPLVGPQVPADKGGLHFQYFDDSGNPLTGNPLSAANRDLVARIEITVRALGRGAPNATGVHVDSLGLQVYLRGN